ncbi:HAD family hydrolase [Marinilactibacillus piezotolerans]|uniref:HAD family hydrolase n=1 Tax=Marinilactibacillus piezotolerans TaxID=258723 RepID=UPI0009B0F731|nr:HAD family hydrolase [Marinilactibacillus piezotolerans]
MKSKIVFLDIDGTLLDPSGRILESTKNALRTASENGHRFYLCTGRSLAEISDDILSLPISGIIGAGGGYIQAEDKVVFHKVLDKEPLRQLLDFFKVHRVEYYLETNEGLFASEHLKSKIRSMVYTPEKNSKSLEHVEEFLNLMIEDTSRIDYDHINKLSFINDTIPYTDIYQRFKNDFQVIPSTVPDFGEDSGEVGVKNIHKQTAIEYILHYLNYNKADTLAFGDGHNDVEMFAAVHIGIAMGNAGDQLMAVADEVTASNAEDGIALGLEKHGLI